MLWVGLQIILEVLFCRSSVFWIILFELNNTFLNNKKMKFYDTVIKSIAILKVASELGKTLLLDSILTIIHTQNVWAIRCQLEKLVMWLFKSAIRANKGSGSTLLQDKK